MSSVFGRIIRGELPCYKVWEDEKTFAFLDINPIQPGHTLVIPKLEVGDYTDLPQTDYLAVMIAGQTIARAMKEVLSCNRVCTMIQGYDVDYFHYHLIPTNSPEDFTPRASLVNKPDEDEMNRISKVLRDFLTKPLTPGS